MRSKTSKSGAPLAMAAYLMIAGSFGPPASAAAAEDADAAARTLVDGRGTLSASLARDDDFRGSERKPAHEAAFTSWLKAVDRVMKESGGGPALGAWQRFRALPAADRARDPLFAAALAEYAGLRYGPDVVTATQRLVRCPTVGRAAESPAAARAFRQAVAVVDSLCRVHDLDCVVSADSLELRVTAGEGEPAATLCGQLDVAPAGIAWTIAPWAANLEGDSLLAGRGATSKGPAMAALLGLRARLDTGARLAGQRQLSLRLDAESRPAQPAPPAPGAPRARTRLQVKIGTSFTLMALEPRVCQWLIDDVKIPHPGDWVPDRAEVRIHSTLKSLNVEYSHLDARIRRFNGENSRARMSMRRDGKHVNLVAEGRLADSTAPDEGQNALVDMVMFLQNLSNICPSPASWISTFLAENVAYERTGRGLGVARKDSLGVGTSVCVASLAARGDSAWAELILHHPGVMTTDEILGELRERLDIFNGQYHAGLNVETVNPPDSTLLAAGERPLVAPDVPTSRRRGIDERIALDALIRSVGAFAVRWDEPR